MIGTYGKMSTNSQKMQKVPHSSLLCDALLVCRQYLDLIVTQTTFKNLLTDLIHPVSTESKPRVLDAQLRVNSSQLSLDILNVASPKLQFEFPLLFKQQRQCLIRALDDLALSVAEMLDLMTLNFFDTFEPSRFQMAFDLLLLHQSSMDDAVRRQWYSTLLRRTFLRSWFGVFFDSLALTVSHLLLDPKSAVHSPRYAQLRVDE